MYNYSYFESFYRNYPNGDFDKYVMQINEDVDGK